ncbi:hypothetical protein [Natrinema pallidum]|uniref:Uncharacterized protein n=1 Tax=Natrinema pallidum DSM 3751 TaxID=1227495 RepID=L9YGJ9_9EURY|nr:hypothetical protein [Natrinema pallidum]ELY73250.1 hypothetical protein C487_17650 [Natrinema pallidum DSM 3751]
MGSPVLGPDATMTAHCEDCDWEYERSLEAGDGLSPTENREIAERVVRSHAFRCDSTGEEWGQTATVEFDMTGGATDAR